MLPSSGRAALSLLLLALLCAPSLASAQNATGKLLLWHAYRDAEQDALNKALDQWNASRPDAQVEALMIPNEAFATKLINAAPRGNGPDLFIAAHERTGEWANSGLIAPWGLDDAPWTLYHPSTVDALTFNDQRYGAPLAYKSLALFYNRAIVTTPPATTDDLIAQAKRHTAPLEGRYGLVYEAANFYMHAPWVFGFGGRIFDDQGRFDLNTKASADAYQLAHDLVQTHKIVPEDASGALVSQLFNDGKAAFAISGPWFLGELKPGLDYGLAPLPIVSKTGMPARPFLTVEAAFVSATSHRPQLARELAVFLASDPIARLRAVEGLQPVATLSAYDDPNVQAIPQFAVFRQQLDATAPIPNQPEMGSVWEPAAEALRKVLRGAMSPEGALRQADSRFKIYTRPAPQARPIAPFAVSALLLMLALLAVSFTRTRTAWPQVKRHGHAYLYLAPAVIGMSVLVVVPFVVGSAVSLFAHKDGEFTFVGMANFWNIITSADYGIGDPLSFYFTLGVTVLWTLVNIVLHVSLGMGLALILREPWLKLRGLYRVLLIIPWAIPNYITALIWKGMFHKQFGAINGLLVTLGLEPVSWFSRFSTAFAANVATNAWLGFPFMMVVILGALQAIPRDLEEAAEVDGASWSQRMRHVVLPLLKPSLIPAIILGTVWTFNMFNIIYLVSGGEPDGSSEILISEAYKWAFTRQQQYGYAAAYAVLIFIVLLVYSTFTGQLKTED